MPIAATLILPRRATCNSKPRAVTAGTAVKFSKPEPCPPRAPRAFMEEFRALIEGHGGVVIHLQLRFEECPGEEDLLRLLEEADQRHEHLVLGCPVLLTQSAPCRGRHSGRRAGGAGGRPSGSRCDRRAAPPRGRTQGRDGELCRVVRSRAPAGMGWPQNVTRLIDADHTMPSPCRKTAVAVSAAPAVVARNARTRSGSLAQTI